MAREIPGDRKKGGTKMEGNGRLATEIREDVQSSEKREAKSKSKTRDRGMSVLQALNYLQCYSYRVTILHLLLAIVTYKFVYQNLQLLSYLRIQLLIVLPLLKVTILDLLKVKAA